MPQSVDEKIGKLLALAEVQAADIKDIRDNMVTRREFEHRVAEHTEFRNRIDALEAHRDRGHVWDKIKDKILIVVVGAIVVAGLAAVGL